MNERIRELANEAGLPTYNPEGIPTKLEKFAELILLESIKVITLHDYHGEWLGEKLKEHFGVE